MAGREVAGPRLELWRAPTENDALRADPTSPGTYAQQLKIWLDFERANLVTQGTHTTEWVAVESPPQALAYSASFAGKAGVSATVETSDDARKVKKSTTFTLKAGQQSITLKPLGKARYVRIVTRLDSDLNASDSHIPVVHEYLLKAGGEFYFSDVYADRRVPAAVRDDLYTPGRVFVDGHDAPDSLGAFIRAPHPPIDPALLARHDMLHWHRQFI